MWPFKKKKETVEDIYKMCTPQPVQLDCRKEECLFHKNASCINKAPAITLNPNGRWYCWSERKKISQYHRENQAPINPEMYKSHYNK